MEMERVRMYNDLAYLWPIISPPEDYAEEAGCWRRAIRETLDEGRHHVLELGVGGGHNLSHLTADFQATAVDVSPRMLEISRTLNPDVEHHLGDMRTVRLGRTFDAVLIHDAVSYMLTEDDLRATFATARAHLRVGGLLLTTPDLVRDTFQDGKVLSWPGRPSDDPSVPQVDLEEHLSDPDPTDTTIESLFVYTIVEDGGAAGGEGRPRERPLPYRYVACADGGSRVRRGRTSPARRRRRLRGAHVSWRSRRTPVNNVPVKYT